MIELHPNFIIDEKAHKKSVVLPYTEWQNILAILEEFDDIRAYDNAKAQDGEFLPFAQAVKELQIAGK
ncbi:MAG: hypothetical protein Q7U23_01785 [Methylococcales bacterium]|nr:hypothetical protein [Methylococcales bacterium]